MELHATVRPINGLFARWSATTHYEFVSVSERPISRYGRSRSATTIVAHGRTETSAIANLKKKVSKVRERDLAAREREERRLNQTKVLVVELPDV